MKKLFLKPFDRIILSILAILGLTGCPAVAEYGTPSADYVIKGTVTDSLTSTPLPNIRIIRGDSASYTYPPYDTIYTDAQGKYLTTIRSFPVQSPTFHLKVADIDGTQNGGDFQSKTLEVVFTSSDWIAKESGWYQGKAQKTIDIKLQKK